jgi:hypothetical protein
VFLHFFIFLPPGNKSAFFKDENGGYFQLIGIKRNYDYSGDLCEFDNMIRIFGEIMGQRPSQEATYVCLRSGNKMRTNSAKNNLPASLVPGCLLGACLFLTAHRACP